MSCAADREGEGLHQLNRACCYSAVSHSLCSDLLKKWAKRDCLVLMMFSEEIGGCPCTYYVTVINKRIMQSIHFSTNSSTKEVHAVIDEVTICGFIQYKVLILEV